MRKTNHAGYWRNLRFNLLRSFIVGFVFLISSQAFADVAPPYVLKNKNGAEFGTYNSVSAASSYVSGISNGGSIVNCSPKQINSNNFFVCDYKYSNGAVEPAFWYLYGTYIPDCPAGSTRASDGTCRCNAGSFLYKGACRPDGCPKTGESNSNFGKYATTTQSSTSAPEKICADGCCYFVDACASPGAAGGSRTWTCRVGVGSGTYDDGVSTNVGTGLGNSDLKTPSGANDPKTPGECYLAGKTWGEINGVGTCLGVPAGQNVTTTDKSTTTTNKTDGTTETKTTFTSIENSGNTKTSTKTDMSVVKGSDGTSTETTTKTTTTDNGSSISTKTETTTTNKNASGVATSTTAGETKQTDSSKDEYCKTNPNADACKKSTSSISANCVAMSVQCTGDALQCAMAEDLRRMTCERENAAKSSFAISGNNLAAGNDPMGAQSPLLDANITKIDLGSNAGTLDMSRLWSGQCIPNQQFSFRGQTYTLDTSKVCDVIALFGNLFVAVTLIGAVFIIKGGA